MGNIRDLGRLWQRDHKVLGVPSSLANNPNKAEGRAVFDQIDLENETRKTDLANEVARLDNSIAGAAVGLRQVDTWAALAALTGSAAGQPGRVTGGAATTHTDPVVGGTVTDQGEYSWSASPAGWKRISDIAPLGKATGAEAIAGVNNAKALTASAARAALDDRTAPLATWASKVVAQTNAFYWHRTTGTLTSAGATDWRSLDPVPGVPGMKLKVTAAVRGVSVALVVWKNEAGGVVSFTNGGTSGATVNYTEEEVTFPADAAFACITSYQSDPKVQTMQISAEIATAPDRLNVIEPILPDMQTFRTWYAPVTDVEHFAYYSYSLNVEISKTTGAGTDWVALDPVPVRPGELIRVTGDTRGAGMALLVWTDADDIVLARYNIGVTSVTNSFVDFESTAPAGAAKAYVTSYLTDPIVRVERVDPKVVAPQRGNTIHVLGDSIAQGSGSNQWPAKIGLLLASSVTNEALGSSTARAGRWDKKVPVTDPLGWTGMSFNGVSRALTQTTAEKNEFITNYGSKWKALLASSPTPPTTLDAPTQALILGSSYEVKLTPYLGDIDLLLIAHGYNDEGVGLGTHAPYNAGIGLTGTDLMRLPDMDGDPPLLFSGGNWIANPSYGTPNPATRDRTYYRGAINYLIDRYLEVQPRGRFAFVGHYENQRDPGIAEAQAACATFWNAPIIKSWEFFGWSQQEIASGADAGKTLLEVWCPDDLHPHSDATGVTTEHMARLLFPRIRDLG